METEATSNNSTESTLGKRIGFWLGIVLFVLLLALPTPESMRAVVQIKFADDIQAETAQTLKRAETTDAASDSPVYLKARADAVEHRARVMLAMAAVTALVACWWISVAIPIPATSLLPLVLFPLVGVMPVGKAAAPYANQNIFLFMGGFIIALAIQRWGLHRRIALRIVSVVGTKKSTTVLGFMIASAFLSMWISNTATTLMMLPIAMAMIAALSERAENTDPKSQANFAVALMLGIAYAASIGGIATPIGTPPNVSFRGQFAMIFPDAPEISFGQWMILFLPMVVVFLPIVWLVLVRVTCRIDPREKQIAGHVVRDDLRQLGPMSRPERLVLIVFAATAFLWMTRSIAVADQNYGWATLLERGLSWLLSEHSTFHAGYIKDATIAVGMAVLLFVIPAHRKGGRRREFLMNWDTAKGLPWGILLLFGGGFAIAAGLRESGLSFWCGKAFEATGIRDPFSLVVGTCTMMTFLTEITSNTATTEVMLPILAGISQSIGVNPLLLMVPATISASCAFMLPVATPPNAIVFGSGMVDMGRMVRSGIIINVIGIALVTTTFYFVARHILGINPTILPVWAQ